MVLLLVICLFAAASGNEQGLLGKLSDMTEGSQESSEEATATEVIEIFRAETSEELEAAISDGYPMPWLEEVLSDTSIPEEDRLWLDHRMRAAIAQELHVFFDEDGERTSYDAEWILPSEDYWRETFLVATTGRESVSYSVDFGGTFGGRPATIVDANGEPLGEVARAGLLINGSRDGSLYASALNQVSGNAQRLMLFYPDGTYFVSPIEMDYGRCGVSPSGEYVILAARGRRDGDPPHRAILLNRSGEIVWERELELPPIGNPTPMISSNDRYCVITSTASGPEDRLNVLIQVLDMGNGEELWRIEDPTGTFLSFSPDGGVLLIPGRRLDVHAIDINTSRDVWGDEVISSDAIALTGIRCLSVSNNLELLAAQVSIEEIRQLPTLFDHAGNPLAVDSIAGRMDIAPGASFTVTGGNESENISPLVVRRILVEGQ